MGKHGKPLEVSPYMTMNTPGHPLAHKDGRMRIHRFVLYEKIGPGPHSCHWCQKTIYWDKSPRIVTDHANSETWDNRPENVVQACNSCNIARAHALRCSNGHTRTMENTYIRPDKGTRMCRDCTRGVQLRAAQNAIPTRASLSIDASGLTVEDLRQFVRRTAAMSGDAHVFVAHISNTDEVL